MLEQLKKSGELYQEDVADKIEEIFGGHFIYENSEGGRSIAKSVLREFRKLTDGTVVWERGERLWRPKIKGDPEGRLAD